MDPVEASFQSTPEEVQLHPSDADFVDVIHTDAAPLTAFMGFRINQRVGHFDFFPNGGEEMQGSKKNVLLQTVGQTASGRSYKYYSKSILNSDGFTAYPCDSYRTFDSNKCFPRPDAGCPQMGHYADQFASKTSEEQQKFFLNTGDSSSLARKLHFDFPTQGNKV
ncbi:hypothetical protein HPG69_015365 [Diceros bicornis minor]|uniref:Lipase domain-containing protein n=1 Tax=Diceros bicornis minor TaxID=77932 RepID=A0A7J7FJ85_DICBM|nr:hypothetical protein HPG69_015365 [Diceros bicornis minor]